MSMNEDYYERKFRNSAKIMKACWYLLILMFLLLVVSLFISCSPRVVTVPEYHTVYVNRTDTFFRVDSVVHNTNTIIREANESDSVMLAEYGIKLKDNERLLLLLRSEIHKATSEKQESHTDTVIKNDSVRVPYPIEKKLTRWEQAKIDMGGWMVGIIIAAVVSFIIYWLRRKRI